MKEGDVLRLRLYAATIPVSFHLHGHEPEDFYYHHHSSTEPYDANFYLGDSLGSAARLHDSAVHKGTPLD